MFPKSRSLSLAAIQPSPHRVRGAPVALKAAAHSAPARRSGKPGGLRDRAGFGDNGDSCAVAPGERGF